MSKWGLIETHEAKRLIEGAPEPMAETVHEMSEEIISQEREISEFQSKVMDLQSRLIGATSTAAHLRGYQARVRELDRPPAPRYKLIEEPQGATDTFGGETWPITGGELKK